MNDEEQPKPSEELRRAFNEALGQPVPRPTWRQRVRAWLSRQRSRAATMGGYWGGVTFRWLRRR